MSAMERLHCNTDSLDYGTELFGLLLRTGVPLGMK